MVRTQIQLSDEDYKALRELARRQGRSMADGIREAIRAFLLHERARENPLVGIVGAFRPQPLDDLKAHDRWLAEAASTGSRR